MSQDAVPNLGTHDPRLGTTLNPGSPKAVAQGCTCPVMDNAHGQGAGWPAAPGSTTFWYTVGCPLHAPLLGDYLR